MVEDQIVPTKCHLSLKISTLCVLTLDNLSNVIGQRLIDVELWRIIKNIKQAYLNIWYGKE